MLGEPPMLRHGTRGRIYGLAQPMIGMKLILNAIV